ncbi:hypothetical protein BpHYR1_023190 [Brachionus plicatilis]|uniref:Uncharacterized protein n=1 Tax=Brachionus plicatilis TaxID=10195 RepID=A0A3M7PU55_BRAPC|nr:hypothetical protein BpHYR1_023190 [Brachionus plicatilis]
MAFQTLNETIHPLFILKYFNTYRDICAFLVFKFIFHHPKDEINLDYQPISFPTKPLRKYELSVKSESSEYELSFKRSSVPFKALLNLDNTFYQIDDMNSKEIIQKRRLNYIEKCFYYL